MYDALQAELQTDGQAQAIRAQLTASTAPAGWALVDDMLLFQGRLFVPDDSALWPELLRDAHEAGHEGAQKTLHRLRATFYNTYSHRFVRDFICSLLCLPEKQNRAPAPSRPSPAAASPS
jgi:hypothetical protein